MHVMASYVERMKICRGSANDVYTIPPIPVITKRFMLTDMNFEPIREYIDKYTQNLARQILVVVCQVELFWSLPL